MSLPPIDSVARYLATELIYSTIMSQSANRKHWWVILVGVALYTPLPHLFLFSALQLNSLLERLNDLPGDHLLAEVHVVNEWLNNIGFLGN